MAAESDTESASKPTRRPFTMMVKLLSSDAVLFEVEAAVASMSLIVRAAVEDCSVERPILMREVNSQTLQKVIEYCTFHAQRDQKGNGVGMPVLRPFDETRAWVARFLTVDFRTLTDLFWAADYMQIKKLRDATSEKMSQLIKHMPLEDLIKNFQHRYSNRVIDTPGKEARARRELQFVYGM